MNEFRVICTDCGLNFRNIKSGVLIKELFQEDKEVYRIWNADLLRCPGCKRTIINGLADNPIAEHWDKEKMQDVLQQCETRTMGKDLFEWREKPKKKLDTEIATQGKPEDA